MSAPRNGGSVFLSNIHHAYAQTDGSYRFPNSREGDLLKTAKREIEALYRERDYERECVKHLQCALNRSQPRAYLTP